MIHAPVTASIVPVLQPDTQWTRCSDPRPRIMSNAREGKTVQCFLQIHVQSLTTWRSLFQDPALSSLLHLSKLCFTFNHSACSYQRIKRSNQTRSLLSRRLQRVRRPHSIWAPRLYNDRPRRGSEGQESWAGRGRGKHRSMSLKWHMSKMERINRGTFPESREVWKNSEATQRKYPLQKSCGRRAWRGWGTQWNPVAGQTMKGLSASGMLAFILIIENY